MSAKRPAEGVQENASPKKQKLGNGVANDGAPAPHQPRTALPAMEAIAKAKKALELQKQLKANFAAIQVMLAVHSGNSRRHTVPGYAFGT